MDHRIPPLNDTQDFNAYLRDTNGETGSVDPFQSPPRRYYEPTLTLMVRDPHWLFTYWEIPEGSAPGQLSLFQSDPFGRAQMIVDRLFVDDYGSYYMNVPRAGVHYVAELQWNGPNPGNLVSNLVRTPLSSPSAAEDENWLTLSKLHQWSYRGNFSGSSPGMWETRGEIWLAADHGGSPGMDRHNEGRKSDEE